ncbi:MAG TPA: hypothetical protein DCX25_00435 [Candidatus Pacebacteria bacterium]|nr:MAG: hypothetical protein UX00_C0003G0072 [Microgenomates group bacterium GW2011_GWB1_45_17]KKU24123.1 MAG: hypothetical protein UX36_C0002G0106 [Microgenomates group bacterium GW2011_GWC1_46_15]KKU24838.1 MAG: hypothetical protein UX35_C0001G0020 [Microgenomates group bacterium GW2011_GWA1_46_15]HAV14788.1 hypothetical protein [Candidatus Paceibacterota bacterium]HCR11179.1 hypothetical protein [Candidatus Paceibacterota bacterium]
MLKRLFAQAGFTMIELLVVIAVIGVLAVAVLSSINPIEQINKGRDTRTRSDAAQLINAVDRFFATQEKYPWNDSTYACGTGATCGTFTTTTADPATEFPTDASFTSVCTANGTAPGIGMCKLDSTGGAWMDALTGTSEVKAAFTNRVKAQTTYAVYVYKGIGTDATMFGCFKPSAKAFQSEAVNACKDANIVTGWGGAASTVAVAACPGTGTIGTATYTQSALKNELICLP